MADVANTVTSIIEEGANATITVIEEIAKQLGVAVDKASELVMLVVPQYAGLKVVNNSVKAAICLVIIIITAVLLNKFLKWHKTYEFSGYDANFNKWCSFGVVVGIAVFVFVAAGIVFAIGLRDAITWGVFPFGKLLEIALTNIK